MIEFEVGGHTYRVAKIDARKQFHIVRRFGPGLAGIVKAAMQAGGIQALVAGGEDRLAALLPPIADAIGKMPDEDADYVLDNCLAVVQRKVDGDRGWNAVAAQGGGLMYDDIGMAEMLQITFRVLEHNLAGFFSALQQMSPGT